MNYGLQAIIYPGVYIKLIFTFQFSTTENELYIQL